jgi:hypothetical protein
MSLLPKWRSRRISTPITREMLTIIVVIILLTRLFLIKSGSRLPMKDLEDLAIDLEFSDRLLVRAAMDQRLILEGLDPF